MYEENQQPLPQGDGTDVFAEQLARIKAGGGEPQPLTRDSVVRWADRGNQSHFAAICRRLLLPGSTIRGLSNLTALAARAEAGEPCLLCLNHRSNLDVPTLLTLLSDLGETDVFHRIVWVAGRKLEEEGGLTGLLVQCINRVIVTPHSWFAESRSEDEIRAAKQLNIAAERALAQLRKEGWVCGLFPAGTRTRPGQAASAAAIDETGSYVRLFKSMVLGHIDGCTLPVSHEHDFTHETPTLDRVVYTFSPVLSTREWLADAAARFPDIDPRKAAARAMMQDIMSLGES